MELAAQYAPKEVEKKRYREWNQQGYFAADTNSREKPYVIVIPPPNITGFLHMGHALNNTLQDILIRWKRMQGYNALWVPGTDHAGIATQNVVEKELIKQGLTRQELGREKFVAEVWKWREQYGSRIIFQLEALGASCDWNRTRFTMDETLSRSVLSAFVHLYRKGLIYRGKRIINWCPRCTTALSDEEVAYQEENGFLYFLKYPLLEGGYVEVATTRPETMLGDTGVAVHPEDGRYRDKIGRKAKLPFVEREIPIIPEVSVDMDFGTGAVKVTPSHDPNDFLVGEKHQLEFVTVMDTEGRMNEQAGIFRGLDRFACREKILAGLKEKGLLARVEPYLHRVGHCYRCDTVVEPYLSTQWFVKMKPLAGPAIAGAEKDQLRFYPERWKKVYLNWLYQIRDWCISRQIWWGHRIPVWYCGNADCPPIVDYMAPAKCPECGGQDLTQDPDVLDTWFSSWLWPFSVFGWPERTKDLEVFYPTDTLVTAPEILFFWVARMVMAGQEFMGQAPFTNVYIHGTVRDITGRKMSKSLGNALDPVEIIEEHGADSLRFGLTSGTAFGQDVFLAPDFYVKGRNFTNKIWNAARFILTKARQAQGTEKFKFGGSRPEYTLSEYWILSLLDELVDRTTENLASFRFNEALNQLYEFFWHQFCDWYLEIAKIYQEDQAHFNRVNLPVLGQVLQVTLKLLHPFIPFVTEEIWSSLGDCFVLEKSSIMVSRWPEKSGVSRPDSVSDLENIKEVITVIRDIKATFGIPLKERLVCYQAKVRLSGEADRIIRALAGVQEIRTWDDKKLAGGNIVIRNLKLGRFAVSLAGIVNLSEQKKKLEKEKGRLETYLVGLKSKLADTNFLAKAPAEIVEKEQARCRELEDKIGKLTEDIKSLENRR